MNDPTHQPTYPEVEVRLIGEDGNAFAVIGKVVAALRAGGVPAEEVAAFQADAMSGDYDHLLETVMQTVEVV